MSPEATITTNDIIFECASCGKSMAIDRRGAGLTLECPDCEELIEVPEYEGPPSESAEVDESLTYEVQIHRLTNSLKELSARRKYLEQLRSDHLSKIENIKSEFAVIQQALDRINSFLME